MFLPFFSNKRTAPARDEREDADDRDLVALINEARTPEDLNRSVKLARMRHSA